MPADCSRAMVYRRNDVGWENSRHYATPPPREMTSEKQAQKFHTVDASLPRSGSCFWLVEGNFQPIRSTTVMILKVTRHQYGIFAQVSRSDVISCRNLWWHRLGQMARFVFLWSVSLARFSKKLRRKWMLKKCQCCCKKLELHNNFPWTAFIHFAGNENPENGRASIASVG